MTFIVVLNYFQKSFENEGRGLYFIGENDDNLPIERRRLKRTRDEKETTMTTISARSDITEPIEFVDQNGRRVAVSQVTYLTKLVGDVSDKIPLSVWKEVSLTGPRSERQKYEGLYFTVYGGVGYMAWDGHTRAFSLSGLSHKEFCRRAIFTPWELDPLEMKND